MCEEVLSLNKGGGKTALFNISFNIILWSSFLLVGSLSLLCVFVYYKVKKMHFLMKKFFTILKPYFWGYVIYFGLNILSIYLFIYKDNFLREILNKLPTYNVLIQSFIYLVLMFIVLEFLSCFKTFYQYVFVAKIKKYLNDVFVQRLLLYEDCYFSKNSNVTILTAIKNVIDGVDELSFFFKKIIKSIVFLVSIMTIFNKIHYVFIIINCAWIIIWQLFIVFFSKKSYVIYENICDNKYKLNRNLGDIFTNIMTIKTFNTIDYENKKNKDYSKSLYNSEINCNYLFLSSNLISTCLYLIFLSCNMFFIYSLYIAGKMQIGDIVFLMNSIKDIYGKIDEFSDNFMEAAKMFRQIQEGMRIVYQNIPKRIECNESLVIKNYDLILKNIIFRYNNSTSLIIDDEIHIKEGSKVAIVGTSGGGKTTLFKLLLGLITPESGEIIIGGQNVLQYNRESFNKIFALVPQDVELFHRTVFENLKYGSFDADMKEVEAIMNKTNLFEVINSMEHGGNSIIGENNGMSGGQKQRLIIARGLLRKARIFLFDESTSALDAKTENDILETISDITKGYTKFVIAHRLKTVRDADLILVFDKGRIVEKGTHDTLLPKNGLYSSLMELL